MYGELPVLSCYPACMCNIHFCFHHEENRWKINIGIHFDTGRLSFFEIKMTTISMSVGCDFSGRQVDIRGEGFLIG
jgi:hypothetical protein